MRELHGELTTARGHRAQVTDVTEHIAQRRVGFHTDTGRASILRLDHSATAVEVTDDITDVIFRSEDVELHDRLEDLWTRLRDGLAVASLRREFERDRRGVNRVEATVYERHFEVQTRVASKHTLLG